MPYIIRPMELADIPEVMDVEKLCFSMPWPAHAYRRELRDNRLSRYVVVEWAGTDESIGQAEATIWKAGSSAPTQAKSGRQNEPTQPRSLVKRALNHLLPSLSRPESAQHCSRLAGYAGFWLMLDEAHVTTIAVRPSLRGQGLGELLLIGLVDMATALGARFVTLEVRVSNAVAQQMYKKFGFREEGVRRRYYSDNGEDALIMWSDALGSAAFQNRLAHLKSDLDKKLEHARLPDI